MVGLEDTSDVRLVDRRFIKPRQALTVSRTLKLDVGYCFWIVLMIADSLDVPDKKLGLRVSNYRNKE